MAVWRDGSIRYGAELASCSLQRGFDIVHNIVHFH